MNNNIDKMCFADLIKKGVIRIPQIQRDYAQGRQHKEVKEIRNHFVRTLMLVITGKSSSLHFGLNSNLTLSMVVTETELLNLLMGSSV